MTQAAPLLAALLALAGCVCFGRAAAILLRRLPAKGRLVYNGFASARRRQAGAWCRHNGPPLETPILDRVVFEDHEGREVRTDLRRWSGPYDDDLLVWYDPDRPERATPRGPGHWALASFVLFALAASAYFAR